MYKRYNHACVLADCGLNSLTKTVDGWQVTSTVENEKAGLFVMKLALSTKLLHVGI